MARDKRDLFGEVTDYDLYLRYLYDFESVVRVLNPDADAETIAELVRRERTTATMLLEQAGAMLGEKVAPLAPTTSSSRYSLKQQSCWKTRSHSDFGETRRIPRRTKLPLPIVSRFKCLQCGGPRRAM